MAETIAHELAKKQKQVSVAEFFEKNRHLLGYANPSQSVLTAVKEAVDNGLDACEEADVLPEIKVDMEDLGEEKFRLVVEDNGPGIIKSQIGPIFGRFLYGSKFGANKQSLTGDEPIIAIIDGKTEIVPIRQLVSRYLKSEGSVDISDQNVLVPAFDWQNYKYAFRKVSHVIKHKRQNEVIKITTSTNRSIKVTGCHSLFSINPDTLEIKDVQARELKEGSVLIVPKSIPALMEIAEINLLDYITCEDVAANWFYVYRIGEVVRKLKDSAKIIHKKASKSRRFYRLETKTGSTDILDDSMKQYLAKGFLPLRLVLKLGLQNDVRDGVIQTYFHGKETKFPVTLQLTPSLMRFLGLFIAEGHIDKRQVGFTFGKHETHLIDETVRTARNLGANFTLEQRETTMRIKVFGNILGILLNKWCGKGAHNKHIPEFAFRVDRQLRQHLLDALYQGDGCCVKDRNALTLGTVSERLANEVMYLWLMQGTLASKGVRIGKGLGKNPYVVHIVSVYGQDMLDSYVFRPSKKVHAPVKTVGFGKLASSQLLLHRELLRLEQSDLCLVRVRDVEVINEGYEWVYDISVPNCENFVGGMGGIACHNSRGQQGIGISSVVLYSQLSTGKPTTVTSVVGSGNPAYKFVMHIDTKKNEPEIISTEEVEWVKDHGTRVEFILKGKYLDTKQSVGEYIKQTSIVNPHAKIVFRDPKGNKLEYPRVTENLPKKSKSIQPHPHGIEFGILKRMLSSTTARTVKSFLVKDFDRVGAGAADEICRIANLDPQLYPKQLNSDQMEALLKGMQEAKIMSPTTDCLSPIGAEILKKSLESEYELEFAESVSRSPTVYKGTPFQIEVAIGYGGELNKEERIIINRFANRVPLLYQEGACAIAKAVKEVSWKSYGLNQSPGSIPQGPAIAVVHMASVWVPFTSEGKEAVASYPEIVKEIKLALQECGRKLQLFISKKQRAALEKEREETFKKYAGELASAVSSLTGKEKKKVYDKLIQIAEKRIEELNAKPEENVEEEEETHGK